MTLHALHERVKATATSLLPLLAAVALAGCGGDDGAVTLPPEPWIDRPVADWPDFALSNDVVFDDTTYSHLANAFTVDLGGDTVGATAKHIFMVFERDRGLASVDPGDEFRGWSLRSSRDSGRVVHARALINADPSEPIGRFGTLKARDWLVFEIDGWAEGLYPLKVRPGPPAPGDTIYAVGRSRTERRDPDPTVSPLRVYRVFPTYYYVQPLDPSVDPEGTSGSPVIDGNGHLVGLASGAVGRLGVVAGTAYLRQVLEGTDLEYRAPGVSDSAATTSGSADRR